MIWKQALDATLEQWYGIRDSIGLASDLELLTEIHAACPLCEKAADVAGNRLRRCDACPLALQFGRCYGIGGEMSERIAEHDLEALTMLVGEFVARLETVRAPREVDPGRASNGELARWIEMA